MTPWTAWLLVAAPPALVLGIVVLNLAAWPRGRTDGRFGGRVSVLIPARDEERTIRRCLRAVLGSDRAPDEVLVYDDGSRDRTAELVREIARADARVRLLRGEPLPPGWVGKPHASSRLAEASTGDLLVFVDADVELEPSGLARVASLLTDYDADLVTLGLRQEVGGAGERLVIPLLHLSYLAWLPLPLVWRSPDPRFLVANGQVLAVRRSAYRAAGGWAAVRQEIVDDMAFARRVKRIGGRVIFADGFETARTRMYHGFGELWRGFSKNLYEGVGGRPAAVIAVIALHLWVLVVPYLVLALGLTRWPAVQAPAALGVAANVAMRTALAVRFRQPWQGVLLHPFSVLALVAIAINSFRWSLRGSIEWRGRRYPSADARRAVEPVPLPAEK